VIVHYAEEESEAKWPVAVRATDRHGLVTSVRIAPDGQAFFRRVDVSKGRLRPKEENWPEEWRELAKDIRQTRRIFLDDLEDDEVDTYCTRGRHAVNLPVAELRRDVAEFKAGHPTFKLAV
jgi:hypothetical protein